MKPEAAVVGAGPAGILAATVISSGGFATKVYEEHPVVGEPNHCAGVLSVTGLDKLGVDPSDEFIQNRVYGGRVYAPDGEFIEIRDRRPRAYVVDRGRFDRHLADAAVDAGVEFMLSTRVEALRFMRAHAWASRWAVAYMSHGSSWTLRARGAGFSAAAV